MPLVPASEAPVAPVTEVNPFAAAMKAGLETPAPEPIVEKVEPIVEPKVEPVVEQKVEPVVDPLKKIEDTPSVEPKDALPIDNVEEPVIDKKKDKANYRIEELSNEVKTVYKPKIAELEQTVTQRDARILELEGAAAETTALKARLADYETEMSVVRLEKTEAFQKEITVPLGDIAKKVKEIATAYDIDMEKLDKSFGATTETERRKLFAEATSGLEIDPEDLHVLRDLREKVQPIYARQEELLTNAEASLAELGARKEQETAAEAAVRAVERGKTVDQVVERITGKLDFFKPMVDEVAGSVRTTDLDALTVTQKAYNAVAGNALPKIATAYATLKSEHDAVLDELAAYRKADPKVTGLGTAPTTGEKQTDFGAAMKRGLGMS